MVFRVVLALALVSGCLARWTPGYWDVGSHDGTMPKCDYIKYPSDQFNPDDFSATGHGCNQFPLRLCGHDENLWPGGVHHDNVSCFSYPGPKQNSFENCSTLSRGFLDPKCVGAHSQAEFEANCKLADGSNNPNCNVDIKRDCYCLHKELFPMVSRCDPVSVVS